MNANRAKQVLRCAGPWLEAHGALEREAHELAKTLAPELEAEWEHQVAFDRAVAPVVELDVPADSAAVLAGYGEKFSQRKAGTKSSLRDPAILAVAAAFFVLVGLMAWIYLAKEGGFAGMREVAELVETGGRADATQYDPMEVPAGVLGDWFVLEGFDGFRVPEELEDFGVVGVRLFQFEGVPVATAAVPIDGKRGFFYSFEAHALGVSIEPEGRWKVALSGLNDENVIGARVIGSKCFVVTFRGTKDEMNAFLRESGAVSE